MFQKIAKHRANDASNDVHRPPLTADATDSLLMMIMMMLLIMIMMVLLMMIMNHDDSDEDGKDHEKCQILVASGCKEEY